MFSDSKKLVLNTRLHADAIVMQLSKGSIPDVPSLAVISMNIFGIVSMQVEVYRHQIYSKTEFSSENLSSGFMAFGL